jgi:predicted transcriptional regulator
MLLKDVIKTLDANLVFGEKLLETNIHAVCSSDLMSDVLAFVKDQAMLITGLVNAQVVRTAEIMDMKAILFVRGKNPTDEILKLAEEFSISILKTDETMYVASGKLYSAGLNCVKKPE